MRFFIKIISALALPISLSVAVVAQNTQSLTTQLLAQPPAAALQLATRNNDTLKVDFLKADLDGSGKFRFVVAFYSLVDDDQGIFLRVFQQQPDGLLLVGDQEDKTAHGGFGISVHLVDINGDGIPEIEVEGNHSDGAQVFHEYFSWTGHSLHSSLEPTADSTLADLDGDGTFELVASNGDGTFNVYKYNGADFRLSQTLSQDPEGVISSDGVVNIVRARFAAMKPHDFSVEDIASAMKKQDDDSVSNSAKDDADGKVQILIGKLQDINGKTVPVEEIDTATLVLVRNLHPLGVRIRPAQKDENGGGDDHRQSPRSVLQLDFARHDILRLLPRLKLTAPLISGDKLQLLAFGKLRNGMRVSATVSAIIRGHVSQVNSDKSLREPE